VAARAVGETGGVVFVRAGLRRTAMERSDRLVVCRELRVVCLCVGGAMVVTCSGKHLVGHVSVAGQVVWVRDWWEWVARLRRRRGKELASV